MIVRDILPDNTPGHSANGPGTLTTSYRGPFDTYDTDCDARPTAAAIVALCLIVGVAGACAVALMVIL